MTEDQRRARTNELNRVYRARARPAPDGLEAEFGPVPARVPERDWFDHVAVLRALSGASVGRRLSPLEKTEVDRVLSERAEREIDWARIKA